MFSDARIENEVHAALERDPRIKHPELIAVSVDEIGTVVLSGAVESPRQHRAAAHDAHQVEGVFDVIADELKIHPPLARRDADDEIRATAVKQLVSDARIRTNHIHVEVSRGRVTLKGYVREGSERVAAAEDVADLSGVVEVANQLVIR